VDPFVVIGVLLGGLLPFLVAGLALAGVGRAASAMVAEVRRQLREIHGILEGRNKPDSERCLEISSRAAVREMFVPGIAALLAPVLVGYLLGVTALGGMLLGATVTGVLLSLVMTNAGAAWDHAKKYIEGGAHGGKGSPAHVAAGVGDALGDPLKALGPALETLVKLIALIAVVLAPWLVRLTQLSAAGAVSWVDHARALFG
jgi:K(+)-stimulated pyrophosphate-energized sodium pump